MERNSGIRRLLVNGPVYRFAQRLIGSQETARRVREEVVRSTPQDVVVDIGCGTSDLADHIAFSTYTGFDPNPSYVTAAANRLEPRFGDRVDVFQGSIGEIDLMTKLPQSADIAMAIGVLHHLNDEDADELLRLAASLVATGGRFVSLDPAYSTGQHRLARFLASRDRGQHVRTVDSVEALVRRHFAHVSVVVHHDLLRVPYTHVAIDASV
jgi:SAM-dependent methyltransferase